MAFSTQLTFVSRVRRIVAPVVLLAAAVVVPVAAEPLAETAQQMSQRINAELHAESLLVQLHYADLEAELEPCINGGVSSSGRFASEALESAVEQLATGELNKHLDNSAYYQAFNEGRVRLPQ